MTQIEVNSLKYTGDSKGTFFNYTGLLVTASSACQPRSLIWLNFLPRIQHRDTGESACPYKNNQLSQTRRGLERSFDRWYSSAIIPARN